MFVVLYYGCVCDGWLGVIDIVKCGYGGLVFVGEGGLKGEV